jgi:hypothetical protein
LQNAPTSKWGAERWGTRSRAWLVGKHTSCPDLVVVRVNIAHHTDLGRMYTCNACLATAPCALVELLRWKEGWGALEAEHGLCESIHPALIWVARHFHQVLRHSDLGRMYTGNEPG